MNPCHLLFLLGSLFRLGRCTDPCVSYKELSDPWRNIGFSATGFRGFPKCDYPLNGKWLRFTGIGGDVMSETCIPSFHSGGHCPIYLTFSHPSLGEGIKTGKIAAMWHGNCSSFISPDTQVLACPGGYYVYNIGQSYCYCPYGVKHSVCSETVCGPLAQCINGACFCQPGYQAPNTYLPTNDSFGCQDIDECEMDPDICGPEATCENTVGSYTCTCYVGYSISPAGSMASATNPCQDIDECVQNPSICGANAVCTNTVGSYQCYCSAGFLSSTGLQWQFGTSLCTSLKAQIDSLTPEEAKAFQMSMLNNIQQDIMKSTNISLPLEAVSNILEMAVNMSANVVGNSGEGGGSAEIGSMLLKISEKLVSTFVPNTQTQCSKIMKTPILEAGIQAIGPERSSKQSAVYLLTVKDNMVSINLSAVAEKNNGSAALMFMSLTGLDTFLSAQYFTSENATQMFSDVISATLLQRTNTSLPEPVNFTLHHKGPSENGLVTCVYWEESGDVKRWSTEGCMAIVSDENSTICSCTHLSTFAIILQTDKAVQKEDPLLDWVNLICMCIGLTFLGLAVLTFLFCTWNPKVNNTARLHLSLTLFLAYLLFLLGLNRTKNALVCSVIAGLLHFLFLSSFVWMFLETLQLFLLVRGLTKVQVIEKEGLRKRYLLLIGYGTPLVVVGVSAKVLPSGYGSPEKCWLNTQKGFIWSFLGPVCVILCVNCLLFCVILWTLQPTLSSMKSGISQAKDTRLIVFKILAQSVILGCAWILGFFQSSTLLQYLFVILNSQQGTFIFIVHCLFNKEVREEYVVWFSRLCRVERPDESQNPSVCANSFGDSVVHRHPSDKGTNVDAQESTPKQ